MDRTHTTQHTTARSTSAQLQTLTVVNTPAVGREATLRNQRSVILLHSLYQSFIYTGDTVTLNCNLQSTGWSFSWYKGYWKSPEAQNTNPLSVIISNEGQTTYYCKALRGNYESEFSAAATVTVKEKPKPELTSDLKGAALTGNSVTLYCTLKLQSAGWKFYWSKDTQSRDTETKTHSYTIRSVSVSDGENLKPVVIIKPDTHVFRGETVTFRCEIKTGRDTEWRYDWYKDNTLYPKHTTQEFSISSVPDYYRGKYTCRGRRHSDNQISKTSDSVTLTVSEKPEPELTSDLKGAALTGNSVTLYCTLKLQSAGWKFYWNKDTQRRETETETNHYFIRSVSVSDGDKTIHHVHCYIDVSVAFTR
ncbi:hypothetical protein HF521_019018 [Silurus meridionalis]|uniref:Ig-like domain-containing protein n=1 Tax=Silurus meridionalis TaxID=175797 RepID=A0A8T0BFH6_SILME|nr:hypothetical protein HF521_019018 [Silurus meridionalis]